MGTSTWALRVSDELKEKLDRIKQESGMEGETFGQQLIALLATEDVKKQKPQLSEDLDELQILTQRVYAIFLHLCERSDNLLTAKEDQYNQSLTETTTKLKEAESSLAEVNQSNKELHDAYNSAITERDKTQAEYDQIVDSLQTKQNLIGEYKQKIDTLSGIVDEYKGYKEENVELSSQLIDAETLLNVAKATAATRDTEIEKLKQHEADALSQANDSYDLQKEKALLAADKKHQEETAALSDTMNKKITSLQDTISSDADKYRSIIEQLDIMRKALAEQNVKKQQNTPDK